MNSFDFLDSVFFVLTMCFIVEQIFYGVLGSYPYRYGITVQTIYLPTFDIHWWDSVKNRTDSLMVKAHFDKAEVYLRYKYPSLVVGPSLFLGTVKNVASCWVLQIKVGPLSAVFVLFLVVYPFLSGDFFEDIFFQLMNIAFVSGIVLYLYLKIMKPINQILLEM